MYPPDSTAVSLGHLTAGDIMTSPVITVTADASTQQVADTLTRHRISGVPVVDRTGTLLGLVSEHDLLSKTGAAAADLMTTAVISVSAQCAADDIRHLLVDRRIRRVPVVQEGRVVGIVSRHDLVSVVATEWVCQVCGEPVRGEHPRHVSEVSGNERAVRAAAATPRGLSRCLAGQPRLRDITEAGGQ